jgi:hypothetical protein
VKEKNNILGYFATLCSVASVANQLVNSSLMTLFARMLKKHSNAPVLLCSMNHVLAKLFRHATFISSDLCRDGIMNVLVKCTGARDRKVRRKSMAALGELLFYVATEEVSGGGDNGWVIPGSVVPLLHRCMKSEDTVLAHYAVKTLQNIYTQGTVNHLHRFISADISKMLVEIICRRGSRRGGDGGRRGSSSSSNNNSNASSTGDLRATAMRTVAQMVLHQHQGTYDCTEVLQRCLTMDILPTLMEGISDTRSKSLASFLDVVNFVLLHSKGMKKMAEEASEYSRPATTGKKKSRSHVDGASLRSLSETLLQHARFLPCILHAMEHASSMECKGRVLVSLHMAVANDMNVLSQACRRKLMSVIDRLFKLVNPQGKLDSGGGIGGNSVVSGSSKSGLKYLDMCLKTTCRFLVHASVSQVASSVEPTERAMEQIGRSPSLMHELAKATLNAERTFPTLLQLLNSMHLTKFFHDVDVVRIVARHVKLVTNTRLTKNTNSERLNAVSNFMFSFPPLSRSL